VRPVWILQEAAEEVAAATNWYDRERPGLGTEFSDAVEAAIDLIEEDILPLSPMPGKSGTKGAKRLILKRFPYDIVVIERTIEVVVIAVAHHSRKPGYWRERIRP
jgi:toxin ParE1/3/4